MFKLQPSKIRSRRQTFTTEKQLILPLSQGIPDREQYAEIMQGYEVGDNYRIRKIEGYTRKNTNPDQVRIEPWGDNYVVFSKVPDPTGVTNYDIKVEIYDNNLTGVIAVISNDLDQVGGVAGLEERGSFPMDRVDNPDSYCYKDLCDGFEFGEYFIFQIASTTYMYSKDTYFSKFSYSALVNNSFIPGNYVRGVQSGAKATISYTELYNKSSVVLGQWDGEFIEGETLEHYEVDRVASQVISASVPAEYDENGNEVRAAYDEYDTEYNDTFNIISTETLSFTFKNDNESEYVLYLDIGALESGDTITSPTVPDDTILRVTDNISRKLGSNSGVFESEDRFYDAGTVVDSHDIIITSGSSHLIYMDWAPQGFVLETLESGQITRMLVGDIYSTRSEKMGNGESIVYYSEGYRNDNTIPFTKWNDDSFSTTGSGGWVAQPKDGRVKDIITIKDGFIALREKGIQEYSFNYYNQGNSSYQRLDTTYFRNTSPYAAISTPEGEFYVSEDGLFRMNLGNASGEYDISVSDILGRRWEDYDFSNSVMVYRKGKLYITYTHCDDIKCGTNAVIIYDIRMKSFSYSLEWNFNDISNDRAVGDTGGFILFQNDVYGNDIGINNEGLPTRFLSKEFRTDRQFYIDGYWIKWIGGDESDLTVDLKGRIDGCVEVIDSQELQAVHSSEPYFQNPTCSDSLGCEEYKYVKMECHSPLTSVMFDIRSDDNDPHEIVEIGIRYTLHKKDYGC